MTTTDRLIQYMILGVLAGLALAVYALHMSTNDSLNEISDKPNQNIVAVDTSECPKTAMELAKLTETNEADWKQADALSWQFVATGSTKLTIPHGGIYADALKGVYAAGPTGPAHISSSLGGWRCLANVQ